VRIADERVITGWVDGIHVGFSSNDHTVELNGRDATGDLVDCSAASGEYLNLKLDALAAALVKPYGLKVMADVEVGDAFPKFGVQEGESVHECLERAARMRGLLLCSDGVGGLIITRASTERLAVCLRRGTNLLEAHVQHDHRERYQTYTLKGGTAGSDDGWGESVSARKEVVQDSNISRHRPLVILAEGQGDGVTLHRRATWERNVRAGRAARVTCTVQGWRPEPGAPLWRPNRRISFEDDWLGVSGEFLIVSTTQTLSDDGQKTELVLSRPEAYDVLELPEPKSSSEAW
jgi:prophage tail gpP-like protein